MSGDVIVVGARGQDGDGLLRGAAYIFESGALEACSEPTTDIPDDDPDGITDVLTVDPEFQIQDLDVSMDITHTWNGDLLVVLTSPEETEVTLTGGTSGGDQDDVLLVWNDEGVDHDSEPLNCDCPMAPGGPGTLADYDGEDSNGDWDLFVADEAVADTGTLNAWCLRLRIDESPIFKRGDGDGNGTVFGLIDGLYILAWAFTGGDAPPCLDAADVDGDDTVFGLIDALYLLTWAFTGGDAPPDPGPNDCGPDNTDDGDDPDCETPPDCT